VLEGKWSLVRVCSNEMFIATSSSINCVIKLLSCHVAIRDSLTAIEEFKKRRNFQCVVFISKTHALKVVPLVHQKNWKKWCEFMQWRIWHRSENKRFTTEIIPCKLRHKSVFFVSPRWFHHARDIGYDVDKNKQSDRRKFSQIDNSDPTTNILIVYFFPLAPTL